MIRNRGQNVVSDAGNVNDDGLADLIVGARLAEADANRIDSGTSYVVFGKADGMPVNLADVESGVGGFAIHGVAPDDFSGASVSGAGDVDGDGFYDVVVGAVGADPNGNSSGASYVVYGKSDSAAVELSDIAMALGGFVINGASPDDKAGIAVSHAGDVNGDGMSDVIVGASGAFPNGNNSGASYVVSVANYSSSRHR